MSDGKVTGAECKEVVRSSGMTSLGHHRCGGCGHMVGFTFTMERDVAPGWQKELELDGPEDIVVRFNPSCDCGGPWHEGDLYSWSRFAETFNMQSTPSSRIAMFERFKAGMPTHEADEAP